MSTSVDLLIKEKISWLEQYAHELPGVVIVHDLRDWTVVWMSKIGLDYLNLSLEEVSAMSMEEYHARYFNPDDAATYAPKIIKLLEDNNDENIVTYFQQVRYYKEDEWKWNMSSTKIFGRDESGKPALIITISLPIDAMHHMALKAEKLLEENNFLKKHLDDFNKLSLREREVLKLLAQGKSSLEIAKTLFISEFTVNTHKRNIKSKLNNASSYDLLKFARAFDLI